MCVRAQALVGSVRTARSPAPRARGPHAHRHHADTRVGWIAREDASRGVWPRARLAWLHGVVRRRGRLRRIETARRRPQGRARRTEPRRPIALTITLAWAAPAAGARSGGCAWAARCAAKRDPANEGCETRGISAHTQRALQRGWQTGAARRAAQRGSPGAALGPSSLRCVARGEVGPGARGSAGRSLVGECGARLPHSSLSRAPRACGPLVCAQTARQFLQSWLRARTSRDFGPIRPEEVRWALGNVDCGAVKGSIDPFFSSPSSRVRSSPPSSPRRASRPRSCKPGA